MRIDTRFMWAVALTIFVAACGTTDRGADEQDGGDADVMADGTTDDTTPDDTGEDADPPDILVDTDPPDTSVDTDPPDTSVDAEPTDVEPSDAPSDAEPDGACRPTAEVFWTCDDGAEVPWCVCSMEGTFICIDEPAAQCGGTGSACTPGDELEWVCDDGTEVPWCDCGDDGTWMCNSIPYSRCIDERPCDDGSPLACDMEEPLCETGTVAAVRDGCWVCLDPLTCGDPILCDTDAECPNEMWCNPCGTSSCPGCLDCVSACSLHGCGTEPEALCDTVRPECGDGATAIVRDGCWQCVTLDACSPVVGPRCATDNDCPLAHTCEGGVCADSGCITQPEDSVLCLAIRPTCEEGSVAIARGGCWQCVEIATCDRFGNPCTSDDECPAGGWCGCPGDLDCFVDTCIETDCMTELWPTCRLARPDCGDNGVAIVIDGCWECVDRDTCRSNGSDGACLDGSEEVECDSLPPECESGSTLEVIDGCWACVNPLTCLPWGEPGCETDRDCDVAAGEVCNDCATGSCPFCEDCVAACVLPFSP